MVANKTILAIVGMAGSGKSVVAAYLNKKGYPIIRFGKITDDGLKAKGLEINPANEKEYREGLRSQLGMEAYAIKIEPLINNALENSALVVLDGLYSWEEYEYLIGKFPGLKLLAVYTRPEIRYQRLEQREVRPLTAIEAKQRDTAELKNLNKGGPIALADYLVVNNEDEASLFNQLDKVLNDVSS